MTLEEIIKEAEDYQHYLEAKPEDNADVLANRLTDINTILARTGYLLAEAQRIQDEARCAVFTLNAETIKQFAPSMAKTFVESKTSNENFVCKWIERLNRTCVHISDNMRTQISLAKENLRMIKNGY